MSYNEDKDFLDAYDERRQDQLMKEYIINQSKIKKL